MPVGQLFNFWMLLIPKIPLFYKLELLWTLASFIDIDDILLGDIIL